MHVYEIKVLSSRKSNHEIMTDKLKTLVSVSDTASSLALADDRVQGNFIDAFAKRLKYVCRTGDHQFQICCIADNVTTEEGRQFIVDLAGFIELREKK